MEEKIIKRFDFVRSFPLNLKCLYSKELLFYLPDFKYQPSVLSTVFVDR